MVRKKTYPPAPLPKGMGRGIRVRYVGTAKAREVGAYRWSAENGYVARVDDPETVLNLMTYPRNQFELVDDISLAEVEAWIEAARKS